MKALGHLRFKHHCQIHRSSYKTLPNAHVIQDTRGLLRTESGMLGCTSLRPVDVVPKQVTGSSAAASQITDMTGGGCYWGGREGGVPGGEALADPGGQHAHPRSMPALALACTRLGGLSRHKSD